MPVHRAMDCRQSRGLKPLLRLAPSSGCSADGHHPTSPTGLSDGYSSRFYGACKSPLYPWRPRPPLRSPPMSVRDTGYGNGGGQPDSTLPAASMAIRLQLLCPCLAGFLPQCIALRRVSSHAPTWWNGARSPGSTFSQVSAWQARGFFPGSDLRQFVLALGSRLAHHLMAYFSYS